MPLFSSYLLCPVSMLLKLSFIYKPPGDLSKKEDPNSALWGGT